MQEPEAFTTLACLVRRLSQEIAHSVDGLFPSAETVDDLRSLFRFLSAVNDWLAGENQRVLLALDEYEQIDKKIGDGVFPEDLLATIRESIQSHRRLIWVFAGSREISELTNAPWTSYLVSTR